MRIEPRHNNLQTPFSNPTGLCPTMSSSPTQVYNMRQLGVKSHQNTDDDGDGGFQNSGRPEPSDAADSP